MKLTMNTTRLQAMLTKALKGAGFDKTKPVTEYVAISVKDKVLTLMTTDKTNYLYLTEDAGDCEDFYVALKIELLAKLVAKMTSETTTLEMTDTCVKVHGNGTYEIAIDKPEGEAIVIPDPMEKFTKGEAVGKTNSATITNILTSIKSALLTKATYPWYCCYYADSEGTLASDTFTVGSYAKGFMNSPYLIDSKTMDLVGLLLDDITVYADDLHMLFEADGGRVYTTIPEGLERYDANGLRAYVVEDYDYSCKLSKTPVLNLLDRISLFVGAYDNGEITLTFNADGLEVTSRYANETIRYAEPTDNAGEFTCKTDVETLTTQIKSQLGNVIELQYGNESAIKIVDGDVISVVSLLEA